MTIDQAMEDSAVIDGAGYWRVLFRIMVPLSKPVIAVIALWNAVSYWNEWFQAMIFASKKHLQVLQMMVREILLRDRLVDQVDNFMAQMLEDLASWDWRASRPSRSRPPRCWSPSARSSCSTPSCRSTS